ncbi:hypothetical protein EV363DRAFT_1394778 [Boletus edulis]|nr:hypothetical protein EV363DRAFT_1394778 [Boletus edulis]
MFFDFHLQLSYALNITGARFPPNASFDSASVHPAMYQIPGLSCPPSTSLPIITLPEPPLSAILYGAGGTSPMPNYHGQGNVYPPTSTFVAHPSHSQDIHGASFVPNYHGQGNVYPPTSTFVAHPSHSQDIHGAFSVPNYHGQGNVYSPANLIPDSTLVARPLLSQDIHGPGGASSVSNYYGQDNILPPANLIPNSTFVARPLLSQDMHGPNGSSSLPNYHGQGNVYPPANLNPTSTFVAHPSLTQYMPYHTAPLTSQWAPPMENTLPQSVVQRGQPKEPGTAYKRIDVTSNGASSARQMSSRREQYKDLPGFRIRVKNKISTCHDGRTSMNESGREQYYCDLCENWVLVHRKKFHNKKHNVGEFVCRICEILGEPCEPLSRKDALKRHIEVKHAMFLKLLRSCSLGLLVPRRKNESEDLGPLFQAMIDISKSS